MTRFAAVLLVDPRGWVLLQERDEHAPIDPDRWGLVGGHVEESEDFETAVHRELTEETGLVAEPGDLVLWRQFTVHDTEDQMAVYVGRSRATDGDIVLGEGRQIVFVDLAVTQSMQLTAAAAIVIPAFRASEEYGRLRRSP